MDVTQKTIEVVADQLRRPINMFSSSTVLEEEGFESLDIIETIFALEESFGIDLPFNANGDADSVRTIGDIAQLVQLELNKRAEA